MVKCIYRSKCYINCHSYTIYFIGGPEGCSQGESQTQATPEQKEKFKELVDIVKGLGQQYAVTAQ